jgi:chemotaxis protein methyltransferase CheR
MIARALTSHRIAPPALAEDDIRALLEAIHERYSYDFRSYALPSLRRRLALMMAQNSIADLSRLRELAVDDAAFFAELVQYLTIPTSDMFRDPEYFLALRQRVIPVLRTYPSLKIWIAGCSTGEEAYSVAILLHEEGLLARSTIYATDINSASLAKAERGIFAPARVREFTANYQKAGGKASFADYFTARYGSALLDKTLRRNIIFADHSLATDNVFSEMQFVSCRNVLIYFNRDLQNRAIGLFHDSLSRRGFLGLGVKETLRFSDYHSRFDVFSRNEKIYQLRREDMI